MKKEPSTNKKRKILKAVILFCISDILILFRNLSENNTKGFFIYYSLLFFSFKISSCSSLVTRANLVLFSSLTSDRAL